ncbi:MAG: DUF433 domain-containing protein [Saprospiraceae bacterium]
MKYHELITIDPEILDGTPVFAGTRVPVESLFWHLEDGASLDEFLDDFPSVTREQAVQVLELSNKSLVFDQFIAAHETVA